MIDPVTLFRDGGPFQYILLLYAMTIPVSTLVALALAAMKRRAPLLAWLGVGLAPLAIGLVGTALGFQLADAAVAVASEEIRFRLGSAGYSVGLYTTVVGAWVAAHSLAALAVALGLGTAIGPGDDARWTPLSAVLGVPVLLVAIPLLVTGSFLSAFLVLWVGIGISLAGLRAPSTDSPVDLARVGSARLSVTALGFGAIAASGLARLAVLSVLQRDAVAHASPVVRQRILASTMDGWMLDTGLLVGALVVIGFFGFVSAAVLGSAAIDKRAGISGALALLPVAGTLAIVGWTASLGTTLLDIPPVFAELRATVVSQAGIRLARAGRDSTERYVQMRIVDGDNQELFAGVDGSERLAIETSADRTLTSLEPILGSRVGQQTDLVVATDQGLRLLPIVAWNGDTPRSARPADALQLAVPSTTMRPLDGEWLVTLSDATRSRLAPSDLETVRAHMHRMDESERAIRLWMPPAATIDDLVAVAEAVTPMTGPTRLHLELGDPPEPPPELKVPVDAAEGAPPVVASTDPGSPDAASLELQITRSPEGAHAASIIQRHHNQIRYCYQRQLAKQPGIRGTVEVFAMVSADGSVSSVRSTSDLPTTVSSCIDGRFMRMKFPKRAVAAPLAVLIRLGGG